MTSESKIVKLSSLCSIITKGTTPRSGYLKSDDNDVVTFIRAENIDKGINPGNGFKYVSQETHSKELKRSILQEDDILITIAGTLGRVAIVEKKYLPANTNQAVGIIRLNSSEVLVKYIYYYLCNPTLINPLVAAASGQSVQPNFNLQQIGDIDIVVPPIDVQTKIVSILSSIDMKIMNNKLICLNFESQAKALFNSWFVKFEQFNGEMPGDWKYGKIYDISRVIYGAPFSSKLFNTDGEGQPIIRIRDLKEQEFTTFTTEIHPKQYVLQKGDIVVGMDGEFKPYIWGNDEALLNQRVCVFENKRENGKFFLYFTLLPQLEFIEKTEAATTVIHIGKNDFDLFTALLPTKEYLDKYDDLTIPMYNAIVSKLYENKKLSSLRDTLLPKLMSGDIDISNVKIDEE